MRPCSGPQFFSVLQSAERDELRNVRLIEAPCLVIGDVGEPFEFRGHVFKLAIPLQR
jgi:hypothetical protein